MLGPFPVVGDCVSDEERLSLAFIECKSVRAGDLVIWFMPSRDDGEQYAAKWLLVDEVGGYWLACKYFAVRYRPEYHVPVARVALIVSGDSGTLNADISSKMAHEIQALRANPPKRADLVVFKEDLLDQEKIVSAIDQHRRHWAS
jgi:hypothetical protein